MSIAMKASYKNISCAVLAALGAASQLAQASGFQLIEQNASGAGNAFAGQAAAVENASTVFYNPAGMTYLPGVQISGSVNGIRPSIKFSDNGGSRSPAGVGEPGGGDNGGNAGDWNWIPNLDLTWQLTPKLWAGIGISAPFGLKTQYDPSFIGRFQSQKTDFKTIDVNPSVAYKINDIVSVGAGVSYQHGTLGIDRSVFVGVELPETISLHDNAWGWNIGAMFNLGTATRLGLSYRSAINYTLTGTVTVAGVGGSSASAKLNLPPTLSVALSHQLNDKWQLLGDVTWTQWSKVQNVDLFLTSAGLGAFPAGTLVDTLDFQFKDTYRVGVGANYRWTNNLMLKFGVAYDKTPVPDSAHRSTLVPDNDRKWLAIGVKHQLTKNDTIDVGYAHLFLSDPDIARVKGVGFLGQGIVSGTYRESSDLVSLQYSHSF